VSEHPDSARAAGDARIARVLADAEKALVSFDLARQLGEGEQCVDNWSDVVYDTLAAGLGIDPCGLAARALVMLLAERGWYTEVSRRNLSELARCADWDFEWR